MTNHLKTLATCVLVSAMATAAQAQTTAAATPKASSRTAARRTHRKAVPRKPSVESQIEELRTGMQQQAQEVQQLRQQLTDSNAQLQQAQQAAQAAAASAQQAQAQATQQAATLTENTTAVSSLQGAVSDLKTSSSSLASSMESAQTVLTQKVEHPDAVHYQGITLSPEGSFLAAETVYRNRATGGGINTPFTGIPFSNQDQAKFSEFYGSGRQSRIALLARGDAGALHMSGYYEADFLSAGTTSNNNQSNSYSLRQRQVWGQAKMDNGWSFTGGQMWSLATENKAGEDNRSEVLPSTIDPQYAVGFVWARQYGARVVKDFNHHFWLGASVENAQIPTVSGHGTPTNSLFGSLGTGGGLYNSTANYAANVAPDVILKAAFEPGFGGHYEVFGIGRFFRNRVYPNVAVSSTGVLTGTAAGAYNDKTVGGGIGGSMRVPTFHKHLDVGVKGLWGDGVGRYGSSQVGDLTLRPNGQIALIHGFSALGTLEYHATPRLDIYANYGVDQDFRRYFFTNAAHTATEGYGGYAANNSGCFTEPLPGGAYAPGSQSSCNADTKDVQEAVLGYWYDIYKGDKGRLRQGIQYSYFDRHSWSGAGGLAPKGIDNGVWTSFRYYLPTPAAKVKGK